MQRRGLLGSLIALFVTPKEVVAAAPVFVTQTVTLRDSGWQPVKEVTYLAEFNEATGAWEVKTEHA